MAQTTNINPIPYLTWNWLKINNDVVSYDLSFSENEGDVLQCPKEISVSTGKSVQTALPPPQTAVGEKAANLIESACEGKTYTIEKSKKAAKPLIIRINPSENTAACQTIFARQDSESQIIIIYGGQGAQNAQDGKTGQGALFGITTKIFAEEGAKVHITKLNLLEKNVSQIDDNQVICGDNAKVTFTQVELGGSHTDASFHATLYGYQSVFYSDVAYLTQGEQYLDLNQVVVHQGKKTVCDMKTDGTLKGNATKVYRGTIDLLKGCSGSEGNEMETTLLLSPTAVEKSAPIILCGEDDIKAEHGSTVGKLSGEMLFYMQSRGIDQKTAESLLTQAKITACTAKIPDESVRQEVSDFLERII